MTDARSPLHAQEAGDGVDLVLAYPGALHALGLGRAAELHEGVALAEQALGALLVEDDARVVALRHAVGDARREVGLDEPRDDVRARALRRQDEVHPRRPSLLREPRHQVPTALPCCITRSAYSSMTTTMDGSFSDALAL